MATVTRPIPVRLNHTQIVLLGMLSRGTMTGYQIKAAVDRSVRFFWGASVSAIYPELKRLADAGLVEAITERRRTTYALTDSGRAALRGWLTADTPLAYELRHEGMLKLFFADQLDDDDAAELVRRIRETHEQKELTLKQLKPVADRSGGWARAVRDFAEGWNRWVIDWCEQTEHRIGRIER